MRVLIALSVLAVLAASARAAEPLPGAAPAPGPGCSMLKDKHSCKDSKDGCTWCESSFSTACYSEDQAKYLPAQFFHCKPKPSAFSEEGAPAQPELAKKGKGGDKKADCRDLKDRKDCVKARAVCSWCKGSFAPDMCLNEDQAKYLPPMVFDCEKSRRSKDDDDDDEVDVSEFPASLDSKKHKKHDDDDDKPGCRDLKDRKHCIKSKAVCGWCESKIGPDLCLSETAAKLMPPIVYKCEESRVKPDPDTLALKSGEQPEQPEQGNADEDADEDASGAQPEVAKKSHKKHRKHDDDDDDKKADCRDLKDRKDCVRASAVCSWCKGTFAPDMCLQEDQARYLPPFVFDCEKSRRSKDDDDDEDADEDDDEDADEDDDDDDDYAVLADLSRSRKHHKSHHEGKGNKHRHADKKHRKKHDDDDKKKKKTDCRDLKDRKDCVKARAVCSWCKGTFAPDMCLDEAQAKYLPPFVFSCEASRRSKDDADDDVTVAAVDESKGWVATVVDVIRAPFSAPEPGPSDPCTDYGSAKKCGRHDGCTWCQGKWAAGQCFSEERAKYLPSSFFKCDVSKVAAS